MVNGQWWLVKEAMHGIVNHSDGQKKWTSMFSKDQGFNIKPMIVLDGVFFAVDKTKIKETFDELLEKLLIRPRSLVGVPLTLHT